ncbi:MAG: 3-hydroxyacyl-CoA dehydrogenase family protein [Chloroflexi bacterium]|nr:3-hydroxyacyl-CoA dehydrogenase family protein [Chloroflexota bacterium]
METIAVVGAGMMGPGIAQVFASRGHPIWVQDIAVEMLASVKERIQANLTQMAEYNLVSEEEIPSILERIQTTSDLGSACARADIVIEAVSENLSLKQRLFAELDRRCPAHVILCSNTSVISITQIAEQASRRERILGTHFWNPPYLVPLVEVVQTEYTAPACMDAMFDLLLKSGKVPVRVKKDVPGFIGNRMQHALWREAFAIIDEGICDAATVDIAVRNSFGFRLPVLGPVANADLVGLDLTLAIHDYILPHLNASPTPSTTLRAKVKQSQLGFKTGSGFLSWTQESMAAVRNQLTTYLLEALSRRKS